MEVLTVSFSNHRREPAHCRDIPPTMAILSLTQLVWAITLTSLHIAAAILELFVPGFCADAPDTAPSSRPSAASSPPSAASSPPSAVSSRPSAPSSHLSVSCHPPCRLEPSPVSLPPPPGLSARLASLPPLPSLDLLSDSDSDDEPSSEYDYEDEQEEEVPDHPIAQAHAQCPVPEQLSMKVVEDGDGNKYIAYRHCSHQLPWDIAPLWQREVLLPDQSEEEEPAGDEEEMG